MIPEPGKWKGIRTIAANEFNQLLKIVSDVTHVIAPHIPLAKVKFMTMPNFLGGRKCNSIKCPE